MKRNKIIALALAAGMTFCNVAATGIVAYANETTNTEGNAQSQDEANESSDKNSTKKLKGQTAVLTIENTGKTAHTFELYQIFTGDLFIDGDKKTLSNIEWGASVDGTKYDETAAKVAEKLSTETNALTFASELLSGQEPSPYKSIENVESGETARFENLPVGYYLVKDKDDSQNEAVDGAYTLYVLQIVGDADAKTKLSVPSSLKKVKENTKAVNTDGTETDDRISDFPLGEQYNDVADYSIGEAIPFKLAGTLPSNYDDYTKYSYKFVDTMSNGLTLNEDSVKVYFLSDKQSNNETPLTDNATIVKKEHELTVTFDNLKNVTGITKDSIIVVEYDAKLNSGAVIGDDGNTNTFHLEYSNNPNGDGTGKTPEDKNIVFTYELDNTKVTYISVADYEKLSDTDKQAYTSAEYDLNNDGTVESVYKKVLSGAKFKLYNAETGGNGAIIEDGKFVEWTNDAAKVTELTSDEKGLVKIAGLDSGTYYLDETEAPSGYNKLTKRVKITINATTVNDQNWNETAETTGTDKALTALTVTLNDGSAIDGATSTGIVSTEIVNMPGAVLPSTGGVGTTVMYVIGGILVICGGIAIFIKRKKDSE